MKYCSRWTDGLMRLKHSSCPEVNNLIVRGRASFHLQQSRKTVTTSFSIYLTNTQLCLRLSAWYYTSCCVQVTAICAVSCSFNQSNSSHMTGLLITKMPSRYMFHKQGCEALCSNAPWWRSLFAAPQLNECRINAASQSYIKERHLDGAQRCTSLTSLYS